MISLVSCGKITSMREFHANKTQKQGLIFPILFYSKRMLAHKQAKFPREAIQLYSLLGLLNKEINEAIPLGGGQQNFI